MTEKTYWIWAQLALGIPCASRTIFECYPNAQALYGAMPGERRLHDCFNRTQLKRMETVSLAQAEKVEALCGQNGWKMITPQDETYPCTLRAMEDYPLALYVWGDLPDFRDTPAIAMVGARKCSSYGMRVADTFSRRFAQLGAVVVSGGALGVDAASHKGAVLGGGKTVAVLGCGLGTEYLRENSSLRETISKNGAVVTEYPPMTEASRYTFPVRNRLISGMSHGTVIVEAGLRSGSLITARLAGEQGREVFAIPGGVLSTAYEGTNQLLRDGVTPAFTPEEVLEQCVKTAKLTMEVPEKRERFHLKNIELDTVDQQAKTQGQAQQRLAKLPPEAARLYHQLSYEPQYVDDLRACADLTAGQALAALTQLELAGLVRQMPGKAYVLSE